MKKSKEKKVGNALKRLLATFVVGVVTLTMLPLAAVNTVHAETVTTVDKTANKSWPQNPRVKYVTRKTIEFGMYPQEDRLDDDDTVIDWDDATPITWQILDDSDPENVLIVADKVLDSKKYSETHDHITWETCSLRDFLNGTDEYDATTGTAEKKGTGFIDIAFTAAEKSLINLTDVANSDNAYLNPDNPTDAGNDTQDKIFLLSIDEVKNASYKFATDYNDYDQARMAEATDYAVSQGVWTDETDGTAVYWLRSPGMDGNEASYVLGFGYVLLNGINVNQEGVGVRPALRINLKSACLTVTEKVVGLESVDYDTITLGTDNNMPIKWRVLEVDGNKAFVFADDALSETRKLNEVEEETCWKDCTVRAWLNGTGAYDGTGFMDVAFTEAEKQAIILSDIENNVGDDTKDYVFLLSLDELTNLDCGFLDKSRSKSIARSMAADDLYWTRTFNKANSAIASYVRNFKISTYDSGVVVSGNQALYVTSYCSVRPAMWVDLLELGYTATYQLKTGSLSWEKDSGKDLTFTITNTNEIDDSFVHFKSLSIGGKELTKDTDYTIEKGSTVVTIKAAALEALGVGGHAITVSFDNGQFVNTLNIKEAGSGSDVVANDTDTTGAPVSTPSTGDNNNIFANITIAALAVAGATMIMLSNKLKEE